MARNALTSAPVQQEYQPGPLIPPPLFCPLPPSSTNHHTSGLGSRAVRWANDQGLVDDAGRDRLERIGIGLLTGLVMPHGLAVPTQLAADFSAWLFAFDVFMVTRDSRDCRSRNSLGLYAS